MSNRVALLIGVNEYSDGEPLHAPGNDVATWSSVLQAVGFLPRDIQTLVTGGEDSPISQHVQHAVQEFLGRLAAGGVGFLFFGGRGELRGKGYGSLLLQDFKGTLAAPDGPQVFARNGQLYLQQLLAAVESQSTDATLYAVIDACRVLGVAGQLDGPVPGIENAWQSSRRGILVTASAIGQKAYERAFGQHLYGRNASQWHGQLTWALTTLIDGWPTAEGPEGRYVTAGMWDLQQRAGALIGSISAVDEPQTPGLHTGQAGWNTALFHPMGGGALTGPSDAPGHEWDSGSWGVVSDSSNATLGWFNVTAGSQLLLFWKSTSLPDDGSALNFQVASSTPTLSGVQGVWISGVGTGWANVTLPVPAPTGLLMNSSGAVALDINGASNLGWTWWWWLPVGGQASNFGSANLTATNQTLTSPGSGWTLYTTSDTLTQVPALNPQGGTAQGSIRDSADAVIGDWKQDASGNLVIRSKSDPSTWSKVSFKTDDKTVSNPTKTYTGQYVRWMPTAPPSGTLSTNATGTVAFKYADKTFNWFHRTTTYPPPLPTNTNLTYTVTPQTGTWWQYVLVTTES